MAVSSFGFVIKAAKYYCLCPLHIFAKRVNPTPTPFTSLLCSSRQRPTRPRSRSRTSPATLRLVYAASRFSDMAKGRKPAAKPKSPQKKDKADEDASSTEVETKTPEKPQTKKSAAQSKKTAKEAKKNESEGKKTTGRKRKQADKEENEDADAPKPKLKSNVSVTDSLTGIDFTSTAKSGKGCGKDPNFKIASWNVNGIRAWLDKDGTSYLKTEKPDVLCIQELKCDTSKIPAGAEVEGYTSHWLSGDKEGYSGVGMYFKKKPIKITDGIDISKHDKEGRVITAEFDKFYLVNTYIPNSSRGLVRLKYRTKEWDIDFRNYLKKLDAQKPVIWCGDLNVAHHEIDIKNAKGNLKNAGFTVEERDSFSATLEEGFFDSFRFLNPETEGAYTFWAYFMNARAKNAGWRLDYFIMSERLKANLCDSLIRTQVMGSDHCPIVLELAL